MVNADGLVQARQMEDALIWILVGLLGLAVALLGGVLVWVLIQLSHLMDGF